ncbi:MAG: hypothetical protein V4570_07720 [Pseudomonadota bacterium]
MINNKLVSGFILISSVALSISGVAAEDIVLPSSALHIRTLAASCASCHGSNGNAVKNNGISNAVLAGMDKNYFLAQMLAFKNGDRPATVMHRHAKGLQVDEINQLAEFFNTQKATPAISPKTQRLKADHD